MTAQPIEDIYTLSPLQQEMLFHILSAPESRLYLEQTVCTLEGDLDARAFRKAWQAVVDRHPALRTFFLWQGLTKPQQVVRREAALAIEESDLRQLSARVQRAQLEAQLQKDRQRGFDLSSAPLMRLHLVRLGDQSYRLIWTFCHLVMDAWCASVLLREVVELYEGFRCGKAVELSPSPKYRDYISWLKKRDLDQAETFWRGYLNGYQGTSALAQDDSGGSWPGLRTGYRHEHGRLTEADTDELRRIAKDHQLTLNTIIQGAWALLLCHHLGRDDVLFGAAVSGRPPSFAKVEETIGLFINTLPHRFRIERHVPVMTWLQRVQADLLTLREYEFTPLSSIQSWNGKGTAPLFESILVFLNVIDISRLDAGSLDIGELRHVGRPHYPLTLNITPGPRLAMEMIYDVQRFRWSFAERILKQLVDLLRFIAGREGAQVSDLLLLVRRRESEQRARERTRRRTSNSDKLRITRPIAVKLISGQ